MKKVILMIVYNKIQYDARVIRAAECISEMGCVVKVISWNSDKDYSNPEFESIVFSSRVKGAFQLLLFWIKCLFYIFKHQNKFDILYLHDYYLPIVGGIFSKITGKKWIYDAHELLFYRKSDKVSFRTRLFLFLEKSSVHRAALVVAANPERLRIMKYVYKLSNATYVLNISNVLKYNVTDSVKEDIIVYQGVMSEERGLDFFINMHAEIQNTFKLKLIGSGPYLPYYKNKVRELGMEAHVIFTGQLNQTELYNESRTSKIGIITYPLNDLNNFYCSPNKIFEYAKLKIPILVTKQPFLVNIVEKYHIGEVIDINGRGDDYLVAIEKISQNYTKYVENMDLFLEDYSSEKELDRLQTAVKALCA